MCSVYNSPNEIDTNGNLLVYTKNLELENKKCHDKFLLLIKWNEQQKKLWNSQ